MTHQSQTNGASLEDCHTNFFALTDLCGIKWRKLVQPERPDASPDPLDDPVLCSYSKCLAVDILCVWHRVAAIKPDPDPSSFLDLPPLQQPSTVTHPPLSLTAAKELWIFWYGEEPDLRDLVSPELLKSSDGGGQGSWESGLSYKCRSLLFKALHNLIERCLLSRDVIRVGKWFVQPASNDRFLGKSSMHLSYSFAFFVHGDSTVCASMDIREHPPIRPISATDLAEAQAASQSTDVSQKTVILAPHGLSATLTGQCFRNIDPQAQKVLDDWGLFFPLYCKETNQLPPVVEVVSGGIKMRYPTKYVLVTDLDDPKSIINSSNNCASSNYNNNINSFNVLCMSAKQNGINNGIVIAGSSSGVGSSSNKENTPISLNYSSSSGNNNNNNNNNNDPSSNNNINRTSINNASSPNHISKLVGKGDHVTTAPVFRTLPDIPTNDLGNQLSMHIPLKTATVLPERVWQNCIVNDVSKSSSTISTSTNGTNDNNVENNLGGGGGGTTNGIGENCSSNTNNNCWSFADPNRKYTCQCVRCRKMAGRSSSGSTAATTCVSGSGNKSTTISCGNSRSGSGTNDLKPVRIARVSFHKRPFTTTSLNDHASGVGSNWSSMTNSLSSSISTSGVNSISTTMGSTNASQTANNHTNLRPLSSSNNNSGNISDSSIPNDGPLSAYRTPHSDSVPIPSVGSPASAAPSPMLDSQTSVPPDQYMHGMSPHPQGIHTPMTPSVENADKNTPAATPTDQHGNETKCIPESSYQLPNIGNNAETSTSNSNAMISTPKPDPELLQNCSSSAKMMMDPASLEPSTSESVQTSIVSLLKRPVLTSRDYENILDDDYNPRQLLYDFSSWEAWSSHSVKRFKGNDEKAYHVHQIKGIDLYANEVRPVSTDLPDQVLALPSNLMANRPIKVESNALIDPENIKTELLDDDKSGNLFTEQGLRPSYGDLEHILDNSDEASNDEGLHVHTPPASNKSPGSFDDDRKRPIGFSGNPNSSGSIGSLELSKMFPTPPSIEHHPNSSPYGSGIPDTIMTEIIERAEVYPNLGSPNPEPIDDWSFVSQPPTMCKFVGSSKYAPLQNLPSQSMQPSVTLPANCIYKPSWLHATSQTTSIVSSSIGQQQLQQQQQQAQIKIKKEVRALTPKNIPPSPRRPPSLPGSMTSSFGVRPRMSPAVSPFGQSASPCFARTPILPPPSYDQAVGSPASTTSFLRSNEPSTEISALLINVLLDDTALNIFRDHNFNSCTVCVCNADSKKSIGNIRGSDSGVYVPLPNSSFRCMSLDGYVEEDPISCNCGFSAVVNRRLAHRAGLFYEDEMEITGLAEDPALYKKKSLLAILNKNQQDKQNCDMLPMAVMDLLKDQCSIVPNCASSIFRAAISWKPVTTLQRRKSFTFNVLEFTDAQDIISLALDQAQQIQDIRKSRTPQVVHKWPYFRAGGPRTNVDILRIMKSMQPLLQDAFHKKSTTRLWDAPYTVQGPLTWRQFHKLAGRSLGQCQPQPIPSIVVGHEKEWLSVAPYAIQHWDKLLLEPYSYPRDISYVVLTPDNDYIVSKVKSYFKELSTTYEMCRLGRHSPIKGWEGILKVGDLQRNTSNIEDVWFTTLNNGSQISDNLKLYSQACQHQLAPYLAKVPGDKTLLDPPDHKDHKERPTPSPMPPPMSSDVDKAPNTPKAPEDESQEKTPNQPEPIRIDDENTPTPHVVVYIVEPFTCGTDSNDTQRLACLSLLRCHSNLLNSLPDSMRGNVSVQIISLESIIELCQARQRLKLSDHMRHLALSIFSQSRRMLTHTNTVKSLTGFGTAASMETFLKSKDEKDRISYKLYTPPYILSSQHEKRESAESFGQTSIEQQSSVLYCNYCLSEDQCWLLAVATDDRGELLETTTINIDIPNRTRRKKASARRMGLQKLMDFILGVVSQSVQPWHLVIGRMGRIGHGELKGWSWLLSKPNLVKASKHLKDLCKQCSLMSSGSVPSILSACLVTLEPDTQLRVMPDQFTPDERFSQISTQLLTPQDVTCTHILVFPVSAVAQSYTTAFKETQEPDLGEVEFFAGLENGDDEDVDGVGGICGLGDIFGDCFGEDNAELPQVSPGGQDRQSPMGMEGNPDRMSVGPDGTSCSQGRGGGGNSQEQENVGPVLQQPLALGYLVSTAPTGRMPAWFWASCPHLENVCPVFLRTALHLHCSNIQLNTDEDSLNPQASASGHPLDSQFTADVLRYILEGYNVLSWLALDANTHDRLSCLPIHVQMLMQLYHMTASMT